MPFTANEVNSKCIRNYDFIQRKRSSAKLNSTDINACRLWSKMFDLIRKDVKETIDAEADVYKGEAFMSVAVYISGLLDLELKDHLKGDRYISFSTFIKAKGFYVEKMALPKTTPTTATHLRLR